MKQKNKYLLIVLFLTILAILLASSIFVERLLSSKLDLEALKTKIEKSIEESTSIRTKIETLSIRPTLFDGVLVVFDNNTLYDPEDVRIAQAGQINVNVRYLPLLTSGKASISRMAFNNIDVYIGERSFLFRLKKPKAPSKEVVLEDTQLEFNNYHIKIDRYFDDINQYLFQGGYLSLKHVNSGKDLVLSTSGRSYFGSKNLLYPVGQYKLYAKGGQNLAEKPQLDWNDVNNFTVQFNHINLDTLDSIMQSYNLPVALDGNVISLACNLKGKGHKKIFSVHGITAEKTYLRIHSYDFKFNPGLLAFQTGMQVYPKKLTVFLKNFNGQLRTRKFTLHTNGEILLYKKLEKSRFNLNTKTSWIYLASVKKTPYIPKKYQDILRNLNGRIAFNVKTSGLVFKPKVTGRLKFNNITVYDVVSRKVLAQGLKGVFDFPVPNGYSVLSVSGRISKHPFKLKGELDYSNKAVRKGHIKTGKLDLYALRRLIIQFVPETYFLNSFLTSGTVDVDLKIHGNIKKPWINGHITLKNVDLKNASDKLSLLSKLDADIEFKEYMAQLRKFKAYLGNEPLVANGYFKWNPQKISVNLQSKNLDMALIKTTVGEFISLVGLSPDLRRQFDVKGMLSFNIQLKGNLKSIKVYGWSSLKHVTLTYIPVKIIFSDINAMLSFNESAFLLKKLEGNLHGIPFKINGQVAGGYKNIDISLLANNAGLETVINAIKAFYPGITQYLSSKGFADIDLNIKGPILKPVVTGKVVLKNCEIVYKVKNIILKQLNGIIELGSEIITFKNFKGLVGNIPFLLEGKTDITLKNYRMNLSTKEVPIASLHTLLADFAPEAAERLRRVAISSGMATLNLILSPTMPMGIGGTVELRNVYATPEQLKTPLQLSYMHYDILTGQLKFPAGGIKIGSMQFNIDGFASAKGYKISLLSPKIPLSFLRDEKDFISTLTSLKTPTFYNTDGSLQIKTVLSSADKEIIIKFYNAGASIKELKYPVYNINGVLSFSLSKTLKVFTDNLSFRYGNSPVELSLDSNGMQDIYLEAQGTMSPLLVNDFLLSNKSNLIAYAAVPFDINLSGKLGNIFNHGKGNNLNMFFNFNIASLFANPAMEKPVKPGDASLAQANLSSVLHLIGDTLKIEQTRFKISEHSSILLEGIIKEVFTPSTREIALSVITDPVLDLEAWGRQFSDNITQGLAGQIRANLKFVSNQFFNRTDGDVSFNHVQSPGLDIQDLHGDIHFDGIKALLNIQHFQIPGVDIGFTALVPDLQRYPLPIANFDLKGKQFIVSLYTEWLNRIITGKLRQGVWEQFFPQTGRLMPLPFEITNGTIQLAEGIVNNLIVQEFASNIRLYPNTYFELDNAHAKSADGQVSGYFAMNPRNNNFMTVHLLIDKMKANAVSRILLNVSNQLFGDLSGTIDYTTEGMVNEEMLANTNGSASLQIEDGRLPAIAKMENLLVAANTISGGLANLNLNSLFRLAAPFNTDYFAKLTGRFIMVSGIIHTDDMVSDGQNLDFNISGSIRMVDGFADLLVQGQMDREIGGVLGPLGRLSFGRFLGIFPPLRKIISYIPGIGFMPGFGGPKTEKGVAFSIKVTGPVLDPGSVKDFKWAQ